MSEDFAAALAGAEGRAFIRHAKPAGEERLMQALGGAFDRAGVAGCVARKEDPRAWMNRIPGGGGFHHFFGRYFDLIGHL